MEATTYGNRSFKGITVLALLLTAMVSLSSATCPWFIRGENYVAQCGVIKEVPENQGILANDPQAIAVLEPELIKIDPKYGSIKVAANGSFIYSPSPNIQQGTYVQFRYNATNGECQSRYPATAKFTVSCSCRPNIPVMDPICLPVSLDGIRDILLENGVGCYGCGDITPIIDLGDVDLNKNGNPMAGTYSFCVKCRGCVKRCGNINLIDCGDDHPRANDDTATTSENKPISSDLSTNDEPSGDGGNVWSKHTDPAHGTVVVNADGTFTYTPTENYCGLDSFTYHLTDVDGDFDTAKVEIFIECNDAPDAVCDAASTCQDRMISGSVADNDHLSEDGGNNWSLLSNPGHGTAEVDSDGTYSYTPYLGWSGIDLFTYQLCDIDGQCDQDTVTITVVKKCNCHLASLSQDGCMYPDELEAYIREANAAVCAECDETPEWSFPDWPVDQATGYVLAGDYTYGVTCHAGGEDLEGCDSTCTGRVSCTCQKDVCPCVPYAEDIKVGCGVSKEDLGTLVVADCLDSGTYTCDQTPVIDLSGVTLDHITGFVTGGSYTVDCSPPWVECPVAEGNVILECDCASYAPDICLPIICIEISNKVSCKDYSLPLYSAALKQKVIQAGGRCTGECSQMSVVLPGNIDWKNPGSYQYTVVCKDANGATIASDTGRLTVDYNCGCGPCGCTGLC